jgi:hypothetical protein
MVFLYLFAVESTEEKSNRARDDKDIMHSSRYLTERDIYIVASQLGESWRVLGLRLNFAPETLDVIARSSSLRDTDNKFEKVGVTTRRIWSRCKQRFFLQN